MLGILFVRSASPTLFKKRTQDAWNCHRMFGTCKQKGFLAKRGLGRKGSWPKGSWPEGSGRKGSWPQGVWPKGVSGRKGLPSKKRLEINVNTSPTSFELLIIEIGGIRNN